MTVQTLSERLNQGFSRIRKFAADAGAGLAVVSLTNPLLSEKALAGVFEDLNVPWLSLSEIRPEERPYDHHYSPRGVRQIASHIADWLIENLIQGGR